MRKGFTLIELMIVIAIIAIIAAIAIPNLLESRVTANESAASASLKAGVFAAQVQFQGGGYLDRDQDNVGEYGTLRMLAGIDATNKVSTGNLRLLTGPLANTAAWITTGAVTGPGRGSANNFFFAGYAPSATDDTEVTTEMFFDGALSAAPATVTTGTANNGEQAWAAACIPSEWGASGRRVFFIAADGQLRSPAAQGIQDAVFATVAVSNGIRPDNGALARAIATGISAAVATATAAMTLTNLDAATYNGYPIYTK